MAASLDFVFMEALCKSGSYSPTGMEPCYLCDKGYHQAMEGQSSCLQCGPNQTTSAEGSNNSMQCGGIYLTDNPVCATSGISNYNFLSNHERGAVG